MDLVNLLDFWVGIVTESSEVSCSEWMNIPICCNMNTYMFMMYIILLYPRDLCVVHFTYILR